jgi:hypothetical protein
MTSVLHTDVLHLVFDDLHEDWWLTESREDLLVCCTVSKSWSSVAMPKLLCNVVLGASGFRGKVLRPSQARFNLIHIVHLHSQRLLKAEKEEALKKMSSLAWVEMVTWHCDLWKQVASLSGAFSHFHLSSLVLPSPDCFHHTGLKGLGVG